MEGRRGSLTAKKEAMDFEIQCWEEFKRRIEEGDTAGALRCYKEMSPHGTAEIDADDAVDKRMEMLNTRLEELYQTGVGREIKRLQEEYKKFLDLQGKMILEMRSRQ